MRNTRSATFQKLAQGFQEHVKNQQPALCASKHEKPASLDPKVAKTQRKIVRKINRRLIKE
jgi:hypothetical protein